MKNNINRKVTQLKIAVSIFILFAATAKNSWARDHNSTKAASQAQIVAHIPFTGSPVIDMAIQKPNEGKRYLYVQHGREQGISIVDISEPKKARVVRTMQWPNPEASSRMNLFGNVAIISETEVPPASGKSSAGDVVLWDVSNPADPKTVQRFSGVVRVLEDDRDFIYLLNSEGLWVISAPQLPVQDTASNYGG